MAAKKAIVKKTAEKKATGLVEAVSRLVAKRKESVGQVVPVEEI